MNPRCTNPPCMTRTELKSFVDRCTRADRRYLLASLKTKAPAYRTKLVKADREVEAGRSVRLRSTRRGLARVTV